MKKMNKASNTTKYTNTSYLEAQEERKGVKGTERIFEELTAKTL